MQKFQNRTVAGKVLAEALKKYSGEKDLIVLALPRGGVPVAYEVAKAVNAPLDVFIVRKLGVPGHEEFAMGAIATGGTIFLNEETLKTLNITPEIVSEVIVAEQQELKRRNMKYRSRPLPELTNKTIILIDDGIATGATMKVAIQVLRKQEPRKLIVAVPVAAQDTYEALLPMVDEFICPLIAKEFYAVGLWYEEFQQTEDKEVIQLLNDANGFSK